MAEDTAQRIPCKNMLDWMCVKASTTKLKHDREMRLPPFVYPSFRRVSHLGCDEIFVSILNLRFKRFQYV